MEVCTSCVTVITGRVVHDRGIAWCEDCRRALLIDRAHRNAHQILREDIETAKIVAEMQTPWDQK